MRGGLRAPEGLLELYLGHDATRLPGDRSLFARKVARPRQPALRPFEFSDGKRHFRARAVEFRYAPCARGRVGLFVRFEKGNRLPRAPGGGKAGRQFAMQENDELRVPVRGQAL